MLPYIAKALADYQENGVAVITGGPHNGDYPQEIAEYVLQVLRGLKCSFDHYYNPVEDSYFIEDNM